MHASGHINNYIDIIINILLPLPICQVDFGSTLYVYIMILQFIILGTLPNVSITGTTSTDTSITVNIGTIPGGIERVIIGYHRLDLGLPVVGEYINNLERSSGTFSSLVPGAKYMIMAWGLGGINDKSRSQSAALIEVTTTDQSKLIGMYVHEQSTCTSSDDIICCI